MGEESDAVPSRADEPARVTALARTRSPWAERWRRPTPLELLIGFAAIALACGAPGWIIGVVVVAFFAAYYVRDAYQVGTIDDFAGASAVLAQRLPIASANRRGLWLVLAYDLALRRHERRYGAHDPRTTACTVLAMQARAYLARATDPLVAKALERLRFAAFDVQHYALHALVALDARQPRLVLEESRFESIWASLVGCPDARGLAAQLYAEKLRAQDDVAGARELLLRASARLDAGAVAIGSPFRAPADDGAARRAITLALAEAWDEEGDYERAWELVAETRHDAEVHELERLTHIGYNAGHFLWACKTTRRLAYASRGERRAGLLTTLVGRLIDVMALDAARAFLEDLPESACPDGLVSLRATLAASLSGDTTACVPWHDHSPWRTLEWQAELALRRGDGRAAESYAQLVWVNAVERHGADHPYVSDALQILGRALCLAGRRADAVQRLREGVELVERRLGPEHPQLVKLLVALTNAETDADVAAAVRERVERLRVLHRFDELDALRPPPA